MQVCNNCGTINEPDARVCAHCRMQGYFGPVKDQSDAGTEKHQCRNCGTLIGMHLPKCPECRFPVRNARAEGRQQTDGPFVIGNLRVG